ncbi:MAG TPA: hypothetical protein HPQ00_15820 [Magnetococcales bacterium]|nr:hypothetical protein [Magnetococcales bacterium]
MNTQCLQPEEVAESAYALLNGRHGNSGGYFLLESGAPPRLGRFGFYFSETSTVPKALPLADDTGKSSSAPAINASEGDFDRLFRQFFRLGSAVDISQARVGESPYWDSLRHIEFILFLESKWGLSFNSGEMDGTKRYLDLKKLLASKIGNV